VASVGQAVFLLCSIIDVCTEAGFMKKLHGGVN
jgi:hypothetical protein